MDSEDEIAEIEEELGGISTKFKMPRTIYNKKMKVRHGWVPDNERFSSSVQEVNELLGEKFQTQKARREIRNNNVRIREAMRENDNIRRTVTRLRVEIANHRHSTASEISKIRDINLERAATQRYNQSKARLRNLRQTQDILSRNSWSLGFWSDNGPFPIN